MRRTIDELTVDLNHYRETVGDAVLTKEQILNDMNMCSQYLTAALKAGIFTKERCGRQYAYMILQKPIHIKRVEYMRSIIDEWAGNNKPKEQPLVIIDPVQEAINLLKSKGYRIMKPITNYEEV